jgi:DNA-binding transcriptional LysR family regulator
MATHLDELSSFIGVAQARSFRDAARRAGLSPSTMSESADGSRHVWA